MEKPKRWTQENRKRLPRKKKRLVPTGYKLHAMRLAYSGGEAMRTIKYPLVPHSEKARTTFESFICNIRADALALMGDLQFSDWLHNEKTGLHPYSLADFYLDSLRAGVIFAPDEKRSMQDMIASLSGNNSKRRQLFDKALSEKDAALAQYVVHDHLYKFCFSDARTKPEGIFAKDTPESLTTRYLPEFKLWKSLGEKGKLLKVEEFFGISFPLDNYPFRAVLTPWLNFDEKASAIELVDKYEKYAQTVPWYVQYGKNEKDRREFIFGTTNKSSALQGYFHGVLSDLRAGGVRFLREHRALAIWEGKEEELTARIDFLVLKARMVPYPVCTQSWAEYRSVFGSGRVGSWLSNLTRQKEQIRAQLLGGFKSTKTKQKDEKQSFVDGHKQILEKIKEDHILLQHDPDSKELVSSLLKLIEEAKQTETVDAGILMLYQDQLGTLRSTLNEAYQIAFPEVKGNSEAERKKWRKTHRANEVYGPLHKDIKLIPQFPGDAKRVKYKKLVLAPKQVKSAVAYVKSVTERLSGTMKVTAASDEKLRKTLETLRRKSFMLNGTRAHHMIERALGALAFEAVDGVTDVRLFLNKDQEHTYYFYRPVYARTRFGCEILIKGEFDAGEVLTHISAAIAPRWDDLLKQGDIGDLLDACELEKVRTGILMEYANDDDYDLELQKLPQEMFEKAHAFQRIIGKPRATKREYGRFLQTAVLSELKGALTKMSRTKYIERYVVQAIGSHEKFPITRLGKQWGIALERKAAKSACEGIEVVQKKDKGFADGAFVKSTQDESHLLDIRSSKYQIQFLKKALGGESSWWESKHGIEPANGEYSFIVEVPMRIVWNVEGESVSVEEDTKDEDGTRLFVSIPFSLSPTQKDTCLAAGKRTRYMGIDVGEFGLAWTVVELRNGAPRVLAHDFIHERLTRNIRDFVQTLKTRQSLGTFGMPSTKLERLRENAITSLRNQVHAVAMRYDAILVYEAEISAFETGSNRVKTIYDSVKRADVGRGGIEAEQMEAKLVWGNWRGKGNAGKQIGAYATSYLCTKCLHSLYDKTPKEEWGAEKKKTRPSLKDMEINGHAEVLHLPSDWKDVRGNSAVYICAQCGNISDADMQASYWIALKRAIYDQKFGGQETVNDSKKQVTIDDLREVHAKNKIIITLNQNGEVKYGTS